jgi:hypothetical protein
LAVFKEDNMTKPNPGSSEAVEQGCSCPVMDNRRGKGIPASGNGESWTAFWINAECPMHGHQSLVKLANPEG